MRHNEIFRVVLVPNGQGAIVISCSCQGYAESGRCEHGGVLKALEGTGSWNRHYWQEYAESEPYTDEELEQMAKMSSGEAGE